MIPWLSCDLDKQQAATGGGDFLTTAMLGTVNIKVGCKLLTELKMIQFHDDTIEVWY